MLANRKVLIYEQGLLIFDFRSVHLKSKIVNRQS